VYSLVDGSILPGVQFLLITSFTWGGGVPTSAALFPKVFQYGVLPVVLCLPNSFLKIA
jgi:hypothetical protein